MAKGVKKIKVTKGNYYPKMSVPGQRVTIVPNQEVTFQVDEWLPGTTAEDKKKPVIWMRQTNDRKIIIYQAPSTTGYKFKIDKQYCGSYQFYIEASFSGKRDTKNNTGIYVKGWCEPKIITSKWTTQRGSKNSIKNQDKNKFISYGHIVYLNLTTEGLNGNTVTVELWNQQTAKADKLVHVYNNVQVIDGEVNLKIENTYSWMAHVDNIQNVEEFYIKVKDSASKKYIKDNLGDELHGIYLNVKNKVITTNANVSKNQTPTKVYKPDVNSTRLEPCKFEVIKITETETKDGKANNTTATVFKNGDGVKLIKSAALQEHIQRTIYYKFDSTVIDKDGVAILNNVLKFLLEHKDATMNLSGYACVIGKENYNKGLSQRRADVVKKFFADGGLDPRRIISVGKGEVDPTDDKMGRDNIKYKNEKDYENNRRVDISFVFNAHDAQTIHYAVVAPTSATKKELIIDVTGFDTNSCFRDAKNKHKKEIYIVDVGQAIDKGDTKKSFQTPTFPYEVYAPLSRYNFGGGVGFDAQSMTVMQYIWPASSSPNQFHMHVHTCRYYSNEKRTTVLIKAYPDIKWRLAFFINLSNSLSIKWQKMTPEKHKELRGKALSLANEEKGKYTDVEFGVELKASYDKQEDGSYYCKPELTLKYKDKISKLFSIISSVKKMSQGITSQTKGVVSKGVGRKLPFEIKLNAPALYFGAEWEADVNEAHSDIGTKLMLFIEAKPLIELAIVFDLLALIVQAGVAVASAGTGNALALEIFNMIREWASKGYETEHVVINFKMYIDLEVKGKIDGVIDGSFSTVKGDKEVNFDLSSNITVELKSGLELKGMFVVIGTTKKPELEGHVEGKLSAGATMGITSGHKLKYDSTAGIYYIPSLSIDPCVGTVVIMVKAGFTYKKVSSDWTPVNYNRTRTFFDGFNIMKYLAELVGYDNKILLWEKKKN